MELELISADEAAKVFPIIDKKYFVGALLDPIEGHVDPYGVTHAYAKAAQIAGAEVVRHTRVVDLKPRADGSWDVITDAGNVHAEHVVNAGGLWAREVGRMVGLELPVLAMQHQYLITEDLPALKGQKELLTSIDFEGEIYTRQERGGVLLGTYERAGVPWSPVETPWDFTQSLLPEDLERIAPSLEVGFRHFPTLADVGIRKVVNGPFTFAPDGNPLVGPIRGLKNFWVACGVMAGFSQGGGVGLTLSQWMVEGDPGADVWGMDVARYGDWATLAYTNAKVRENYSRRFRIRFPNEELPAARPLRTTPVYGQLQAALRQDADPFRQAFYRSHPWGTPDQVIKRATELAEAFGTDENDETTSFNGTIPQVLMMMNGELTNNAIGTDKGGFLHNVASNGRLNNAAKINYLFESGLARHPTNSEVNAANALLASRGGDALAVLQDVWWAILNSNEFILNH